MQNNEQLRNILAENGKLLTENERRTIAETQEQAGRIVEQQFEPFRPSEAQQEVGTLERMLLGVPAVVNFISDVGNTLTTLTQAMIPASLPFLLVFLVFAEAERVRYGVALFEVHDYLAYIVAYILVIGNAFVELAIQHRHAASDYQRATGYQFSFRLFARRMGYVFGVGDNWSPMPKSPALRLERLQAALTASILFLAIGGSMTETIERQQGNWRAGFVAIFRDSTLLEMLTWLSGLVAAVVIVLLAQAIVAYAYGRASEYYYELVERRGQLESGASPDLERWQEERHAAVVEAQQQAEREILIRILSKKGIALNAESSGNTLQGWAVPESTQTTKHVNGHGTTVVS